MRVREWCDQVSSLLCICMCVGFPFNYFIIIIERKLFESALFTCFLLLSRGSGKTRENGDERKREQESLNSRSRSLSQR